MGLVPSRFRKGEGLPDLGATAMSWRTAWGVVAAGIVVLIALFWSTAAQMVTVWINSQTFNHSFLILPICGYLVWIKRGALANEVPRPTWWGLGVILAAGFTWLVGDLASVSMIQQFALVFMMQGLIFAVLGLTIAKLLLFPLFYMLFAVPFGEFLIAPLQDLTAVFVVKVLQALGIPVFLDGIFISIPTGNFEVAEACAGVRFLIATVALGTLFAHLTFISRWRQSAFIAFSFIVPIIANGFRAFGIVYIAYLSNNEIAVGFDHIVYGWIFFAVITVLLLLLGMSFRDGSIVDAMPDEVAIRAAASKVVRPGRIGLVALVSLLASAVAPIYSFQVNARSVPKLSGSLPNPVAGNGWQLTKVEQKDWAPIFPAAHARLLKRYSNGRAWAVGFDHIVYGWIFFAVITVLLLLLGMSFRDGSIVDAMPDEVAIRAAASKVVRPGRIGLVALVSLLASAVAPIYSFQVNARSVPKLSGSLPNPVAGNGWQLTKVEQKDWAPIFPAAHARLLKRYSNGRASVDVFVAYYIKQRQGVELIGDRNSLADGVNWTRASSGQASVDVAGKSFDVYRERMVRFGRRNRIAYQWYWVGGEVTSNVYLAKLYQARGHLIARGEAAATIVVSAPYSEVAGEADSVLRDFMNSVQPIESQLQRFSRAN